MDLPGPSRGEHLLVFALCIALRALTAADPTPEPLPPAPDAFAFAESLLEEGDYYRAIGEYKRALFLNPEGLWADEARLEIGVAYLRGGQPEAAEGWYAAIEPAVTAELRPKVSLQRAFAVYQAGDAPRAQTVLRQWLAAHPERGPLAHRAHYLLGWNQLKAGDAAGAAAELEAAGDFPGKAGLLEKTAALSDLPYRSPLVAALLSVVPGGGHLYLGQPLTALAAFAWNGLFGYGLYDSVRTRQYGVAVVLGVFQALWYFGTLFGAVSGAQKYNRDALTHAVDELKASHDDRPEGWPPAR